MICISTRLSIKLSPKQYNYHDNLNILYGVHQMILLQLMCQIYMLVYLLLLFFVLNLIDHIDFNHMKIPYHVFLFLHFILIIMRTMMWWWYWKWHSVKVIHPYHIFIKNFISSIRKIYSLKISFLPSVPFCFTFHKI